jgi:hypothetical protein
MKFEYSKDKYSFLNVKKDFADLYDERIWVINFHKNEGWRYNQTVYSIIDINNDIATCVSYDEVQNIPLKDLSLTKEEAVNFELEKLIQKLSEEDRELIKDLLEKQAQFRELEFAGEYC